MFCHFIHVQNIIICNTDNKLEEINEPLSNQIDTVTITFQ